MDASIKLIPTGNPANPWNISNGDPFLKKDSGAHVLTFQIVSNQTGKDITFGPDPMWVQMGSKPNGKPPVGSDQGQIGAWKVLDNGHQLVVVDWNNVPGQLYYKLNFTGYYPTLDPIIDNGGGIKPPPTGFQFADFVGYAIVAIVALFAGMFVQKAFFSRRAG